MHSLHMPVTQVRIFVIKVIKFIIIHREIFYFNGYVFMTKMFSAIENGRIITKKKLKNTLKPKYPSYISSEKVLITFITSR